MGIIAMLSIFVAALAAANFGFIMYHHFATGNANRERFHAVLGAAFICIELLLVFLDGGMIR